MIAVETPAKRGSRQPDQGLHGQATYDQGEDPFERDEYSRRRPAERFGTPNRYRESKRADRTAAFGTRAKIGGHHHAELDLPQRQMRKSEHDHAHQEMAEKRNRQHH